MSSSKFAFLGPHGTYSDLALRKLAPGAKTLAKQSLNEVFQSVVNGEVDAGLVPIENKIQGPVTETLDLLFSFHDKIHIIDSLTSSIKHCLGTVLSDSPLNELSEVYSHQQALDQCSKYLGNSLPGAARYPFESTSKAATLVAEKKLAGIAAIAAEETILNAGLHVREKDIGNISDNQTRFVIIKLGQPPADKLSKLGKGEEFVTSLILHPGRDRQGLLFELLEIISVQHRINLLSIHSRPDLVGGFVFHLEMEGHISDTRTSDCVKTLTNYCQEQTADVAKVIICGSYKRSTFRKTPFDSIGIIGAHGTMGSFFSKFFEDAGISVTACDIKTKITPEKLVKDVDVIFLSLPMSEITSITSKIAPLLRPGQLIIENCSVKHAALLKIEEIVPAGVEVLGIHTMFGGDISNLRDQNIVITETQSCGPLAQSFADLLYKHGARLTKASTLEHDKRTSFVQSLVHFSSICMADVMRESFSDPDELEAFSTPNARRTIETLRRVVAQHPTLSSDLQTLNPEAIEMRIKFLKKVFELTLSLNNADTEPLLKTIEKSKLYFSKDNN